MFNWILSNLYTRIQSLRWSPHQGEGWKEVRLALTPLPFGIAGMLLMNVNSLLPQSPPPSYALVWLLGNYFSTTAFNKMPCSKPGPIFSPAEGCGCNQGRDWQIWVTPVLRLAGTQKLASSQTGLCVTVAHLSEIFFQAINYYIWTSHPRSREPLASCSKNQSSFTTFTLAQLQLFIHLARLFKDAVAFFREDSCIPEQDSPLVYVIPFFLD